MKTYTSEDPNSYSNRSTKESERDYKRHRITFTTKWSVPRKQMVTTYAVARLNVNSKEFDTKDKALVHAKSFIDMSTTIL